MMGPKIYKIKYSEHVSFTRRGRQMRLPDFRHRLAGSKEINWCLCHALANILAALGRHAGRCPQISLLHILPPIDIYPFWTIPPFARSVA